MDAIAVETELPGARVHRVGRLESDESDESDESAVVIARL